MKILIVDDDPSIRQLLQVTLEVEGYEVIQAEDGEKALAIVAENNLDLVILDLMLPRMDGWKVCRLIRQDYDLPIIMLTAKDDEVDTILGLKLGADDYISKPFSPRELVARIEAVMRRVTNTASKDLLFFPGMVIDQSKRMVKMDDKQIDISPTEFALLWEMAHRPGQVYEREVLLDRVWGYDYIGTNRTVDVHIKRLRSKLEKYRTGYTYIQTVWGIGYKFEVIPIG